MTRRFSLWLVVVSAFLGTTWVMYAPASSADDEAAPASKEQAKQKPANKKAAMKAFMRKKLESSQSLLEGLVVEDFDLIAKGAKELKTTGAAAEFLVVNDPIYVGYADDFRRIVDKMDKAAKEKRLDGAALAYVDMTLSCVECHKYVRNVLVAQ